jgi:hypothetical protein
MSGSLKDAPANGVQDNHWMSAAYARGICCAHIARHAPDVTVARARGAAPLLALASAPSALFSSADDIVEVFNLNERSGSAFKAVDWQVRA